ncbi:heme o synthase [Dyella silvatica]|uniref:heme o synthase n=1 Tax=Dyella silvatica TaxID=2992128 RepID=UPI002255FFD9|nr:heme o synthase [Dyella silvatica]
MKSGQTQSSVFREYLELTKPRVVALLVFCAIIGMFLAVPGIPPWRALLFGTIGIWMASASAAAFNHLIDQRIDKLMARTAHRPLATGHLTPRQVLLFALTLGLVSMLVLVLLVNPLTALLTFGGLIGYAVVYTAYLKRATPQNIVIGGLAGAIPPVLGWTAVTGSLHPFALQLCLIIFVWTPPHFWALAIFRRDDYSRAQVPMLPVTHGVVYTRWHVLFYTILLVLVTLLPTLTGYSGLLYLGGAVVLGGGFLYYAVRLLNPPDELFAMKVFNYSIVYLMALFAFLLADHWLFEPLVQQGLVFQPAS